MTITRQVNSLDPGVVRRHVPPDLGRKVVGGFYLVMAGINLGMIAADPSNYATFADHGLFAFVRDGWHEIVMANPSAWIALLAAGELTFGTLLLAGGRAARIGWVCVLTFHVLLLVFGWGIWFYAVPALVLLSVLARHDLRPPAAVNGSAHPT